MRKPCFHQACPARGAWRVVEGSDTTLLCDGRHGEVTTRPSTTLHRHRSVGHQRVLAARLLRCTDRRAKELLGKSQEKEQQMKKRKQRKRETSRAADFSTTNDKATTQGDHRKKRWPDLSLEELVKDHVGSADKAALFAEHAVVTELQIPRAGIGDWPAQQGDHDGGD